ncbi:MAG: ATP synthase F1 subunit delta [Gemmatimonadaceae bacterium]|nr:ATP synthase F1 subunit delta [Gemmatimonadaceae bacterium]
MREPTIARNYAEALVSLAERAGELDGWGETITEIADAIAGDTRLANFLGSPKVSAKGKVEIITRAFQDRLPRLFVRFLGAVIANRRQHLIPQIASEYALIVDEMQGRVHARVTVAREPDDAMRSSVERQLGTITGKRVVTHFVVKPEILGGVIARVGDTVMDGSLARRLESLRGHMLGRAS